MRWSSLCAACSAAAMARRRGATAAIAQNFAQIERGRYLADRRRLHRLPHRARRGKPFAGGAPIETPFGIMLLAQHHARPRNRHRRLDRRRIRTRRCAKARGPDGEHLYPAMPYPYYTKMTRDDVARDPRLSPHGRAGAQSRSSPTSCRSRSTSARPCGWNCAVFQRRRIQARSEEVGRMESRRLSGRRASAIAAPATRRRTSSAATRPAQYLQGATLQGWFAPDITSDSRRGLGSWSRRRHRRISEDRPQPHRAATGPMAEVVDEVDVADDRCRPEGDRDLSQGAAGPDRCAARRCRPPIPPMNAGEAIYRDQCAACHGPEREGCPLISSRPWRDRRTSDPQTRPALSASSSMARAAWRPPASRPARACPHSHGN